MKRIQILIGIVSCLLAYSLQAMDVPALIESIRGADDAPLKIQAQSVYCTVNGQEYRLSDLLERGILVVGTQNQDIARLQEVNQINGPILQSCVNAINEHVKVINQHAEAITHNGNAVTNHAGFINKHEAMLSNTTYEINKASAIYLVAQHPIIKSLTVKCHDPEASAILLTTLLVEGSLRNLDSIVATCGAAYKTLWAIGISNLTNRLIHRCGLDKYAQSEVSKMATFVAARTTSHHVMCFLATKGLQYINKNYSPA